MQLDPDRLHCRVIGTSAARIASIVGVDRMQTTQGTLARLGFSDSATAERLLAEWGVGVGEILDLLADVADPDLPWPRSIGWPSSGPICRHCCSDRRPRRADS